MKKVGVFFSLILISTLLGGIYGIAHDQITFTISPEYYTKFKFIQFGLIEDSNQPNYYWHIRFYVSIVGFMATWWFGLLLGITLSLVGLLQRKPEQMFFVTVSGIGITTSVAFVIGLVGLVYGFAILAYKPLEEFTGWFIPEGLVDFESFVAVGSMHNFSYAGGLIGLLIAICYSVIKSRKNQMRGLNP